METNAVQHDGQWYVVLVQGCRRQFYQVKTSAKKFSAQMEKIAEAAVPAVVCRLFVHCSSEPSPQPVKPRWECQPAMGDTGAIAPDRSETHGGVYS